MLCGVIKFFLSSSLLFFWWGWVSVGWNRVDERLIRQGELLLSLDFLKRYDEGVRKAERRGMERSQGSMQTEHTTAQGFIDYWKRRG